MYTYMVTPLAFIGGYFWQRSGMFRAAFQPSFLDVDILLSIKFIWFKPIPFFIKTLDATISWRI